jgi:hypothetical protein
MECLEMLSKTMRDENEFKQEVKTWLNISMLMSFGMVIKIATNSCICESYLVSVTVPVQRQTKTNLAD